MRDKLADAENHMKKYEQRKAAGLCVDCGKSPVVDGKVRCQPCIDRRNQRSKTAERKEYHRSYIADTRAYRKEHHLCTECRKQDARTLIGKSLCFECLRQKTDIGRLRRTDLKAREKEYENAKKRRQSFSEAGLCSQCGKRLAESGYKTCSKCRAASRKRNQKRKNMEHRSDPLYGIPRIQWPDLGYCYKCKAPLDGAIAEWNTHDGKSKLCKSCYDKLVKAGEKGRASAKKQVAHSPAKGVDEFWRLVEAKTRAV